MSKKDVALILLTPAILIAFVLFLYRDQVAGFILGPIDDPGYFCSTPDPSPRSDLGTTVVLQECSAGKIVTIKRGQTVAVDLPQYYCVDLCSAWQDLGVSNKAVLGTVVAPTTKNGRFYTDVVATYRALQTGQSTISAVIVQCSASNGGGCGRGHRWSVTVRVA